MSPTDYSVTVRAQSAIKKGQEITIQYISFVYGHLKRKRQITNCWLFECQCKRCLDPTEMGSNLSAVKCKACQHGFSLPMDAANINSSWICSICSHQENLETIEGIVSNCFDAVYQHQERGLTQFDDLLQDLLQKLHPNHYIGKNKSI